MLKFIVILLDNSSISYCHYDNCQNRKLISTKNLKQAIFFAMKENLSVQFVWPEYDIPQSHKDIINSIDHISIMPLTSKCHGDIIVLRDKDSGIVRDIDIEDKTVIKHVLIRDFIKNPTSLKTLVRKVKRLNIVFSDILAFNDSLSDSYAEALSALSYLVLDEYKTGHPVEVNILTDRIMLDEMNNCNAGYETICVAPDGKFYICPAFYYAGENSVGSLEKGLSIKNPNLLKRDFAPICRNCDAYQCRRCVFHNKLITLEMNTPGHEQCVMSHIEREASRNLLKQIREFSDFMPGTVIDEVNCYDPFERIK